MVSIRYFSAVAALSCWNRIPAARATSIKVTLLGGEASAKRKGPGAKLNGASPPNMASRLVICRRVILDISPRRSILAYPDFWHNRLRRKFDGMQNCVME